MFWSVQLNIISIGDPIKTIHQFLEFENTASSRELAKKAVVILSPELLLGKVVWYKQKDLTC